MRLSISNMPFARCTFHSKFTCSKQVVPSSTREFHWIYQVFCFAFWTYVIVEVLGGSFLQLDVSLLLAILNCSIWRSFISKSIRHSEFDSKAKLWFKLLWRQQTVISGITEPPFEFEQINRIVRVSYRIGSADSVLPRL